MLEHVVDIILVEDNPNDAELTLDALQTHGLANRVKVLKDGQEALDYFFGTGAYAGLDVCDRPKVVLLDLKLPKVDGLDVLRSLRADERTRTLPVVVLTSSNEHRDRIRSYDLGVNSYIVKPVEFDNFSEAVAEIGFYWVLMNKVPF
ncbi:MAG: response regulator [Syntrophales bacterium]|jgi:two-component system response regulator|nr:response regulator [Syntrophales bacterium]MCK9390195.1 response regulator [Syntrophales bacterium]